MSPEVFDLLSQTISLVCGVTGLLESHTLDCFNPVLKTTVLKL